MATKENFNSSQFKHTYMEHDPMTGAANYRELTHSEAKEHKKNLPEGYRLSKVKKG